MKLHKLAERIGSYGDQLVARAAPKAQNQWIVKEIRTVLDKKMSEHSSKPELAQHFCELFCGLEKIAEPLKNQKDPLDSANTEAEIIDAFDSRYFRGEASFKFAQRLLADPRVSNVEHFTKAVSQGGTILRNWTNTQREMFQLHATNKLWLLGRYNEAKNKLAADYDLFWKDQLVAQPGSLNKIQLQMLVRALAATKAVPLADMLAKAHPNWRSLYALWHGNYRYYADFEPDDSYLWRALQHVAASAPTLPEDLNFIPSIARDAPSEIRTALLRYARAVKDEQVLDLLLESSGGKDKVVEVGVIATKLAIG